MRTIFFVFILLLISCKPSFKEHIKSQKNIEQQASDFVIAFGSCNNQQLENPFWEQLTTQKPDVWIWGGDIIYSDTEDMKVLRDNYQIQQNNIDYQNFIKNTTIMGTWDDHDYGVNDGGTEYWKKKESQQLFLDFLNVAKDDSRRIQEGIYFSKTFDVNAHSVKIIVLDTRYFRSALTPDKKGKKRYVPNKFGEGTMLGETQWNWLKNELSNSKAYFNIIMSSVQVLSNQHGFETWGNMPHEVEKLENIIIESKAKGVILLSGDRHISEISLKKIGKESIPLVDFTSSGMTHSYAGFSGEENPYRVSEVVFEKSYGIIRLNFQSYSAEMEMWGENNKSLEYLRIHF
ncbi:MAG: alkaline phosphatase D family protein [Flavobacteriaceae bacterium]|nr:alkaline phosphatase D family protein [Flavobacteriaceae bacterium]